MPNDKRMAGKKVLVTGAGTGIGWGIAREFCWEGAEVVFHYSRSREGAMAAVEEVRRNGALKVTAVHADFGDVGEAVRMAEEAIADQCDLDPRLRGLSRAHGLRRHERRQ